MGGWPSVKKPEVVVAATGRRSPRGTGGRVETRGGEDTGREGGAERDGGRVVVAVPLEGRHRLAPGLARCAFSRSFALAATALAGRHAALADVLRRIGVLAQDRGQGGTEGRRRGEGDERHDAHVPRPLPQHTLQMGDTGHGAHASSSRGRTRGKQGGSGAGDTRFARRRSRRCHALDGTVRARIASVDALDSAVDALDGAVDLVITGVDALDTSVHAVIASVDALDTSVHVVIPPVDALDTSVDVVITSVEALDSSVHARIRDGPRRRRCRLRVEHLCR